MHPTLCGPNQVYVLSKVRQLCDFGASDHFPHYLIWFFQEKNFENLMATIAQILWFLQLFFFCVSPQEIVLDVDVDVDVQFCVCTWRRMATRKQDK